MSNNICTEVEIDAPIEVVWQNLMDFSSYPRWNPFIKSLTGEAQVGKRLAATIQPPSKSPMTFKPVVLVVDVNKEFRWRGNVLTDGLFAGEHIFQLVALTPTTTKLIHSEKFSGILNKLIMRGSTLQASAAGFVAMNEALKKLCTE